jgi:hypothetical protein
VEAADRARDGRDREHVHQGGGASKRHQTTGTATVTGGAFSGELDMSFAPAPAAHDRRITSTADYVGDEREQERRGVAGPSSRNTCGPVRALVLAVQPGSERHICGGSRRRPLLPGSSSLDLGSCASSGALVSTGGPARSLSTRTESSRSRSLAPPRIGRAAGAAAPIRLSGATRREVTPTSAPGLAVRW